MISITAPNKTLLFSDSDLFRCRLFGFKIPDIFLDGLVAVFRCDKADTDIKDKPDKYPVKLVGG